RTGRGMGRGTGRGGARALRAAGSWRYSRGASHSERRVHLLVLLSVPILVGAAAFFLGKRRITPRELGIQLGVGVALMFAGYHVSRWTGVQDTEIWNGRIADKSSHVSGCCHSYPCNCREECSTDSEGATTCAEVCDTCYEHSYDN